MDETGRSAEVFREGPETPAFSRWLRDASEPFWTRASEHRFTRHLADGSLKEGVFRRYLIQDYVFVEHAVSLVASAAAAAPGMAAKRRLVEHLNHLTDDENDYFLRAFEALGVESDQYTDPPLHPATRNFQHLIGRVRGAHAYEELLAVFLAAEWIYLTWGEAVDASASLPFYYREWIELHREAVLGDVVGWLRDQLDARGPDLAPYRQRRVRDVFRETARLEVAFFDAPYEGDADRPGIGR